jgi:formylglycine-generating enzyme required for sulfatase activity
MVLALVGQAAMAMFRHSDEHASAGKRVALVIGNSAYTNAPALTNPKNDAEDMAAALKALGLTVILGTDLDKRAMDRKILEFSNALSGADVGVFHYSGHGLQVAGVNYLVPIDAALDSAVALDFEAVRLDLVQRTMEREAKTNILFLDACRNNPFTRSLARALGTRSADIGRGLAPVESGAGTLISFSTQPGNVALDGEGRNSPYSGPLVKAIGTPGEDVLSMLTGVRNAVMAATAEKQVPWDNNALRAKFYFHSAPALATPAAPLSADAQAWSLVQNSASEAVLEEYIRRFPDSVYAGFAKARLDELKQSKAAQAPAAQTKPALAPKDTQVAVVAPPKPPPLKSRPTLAPEYSLEGQKIDLKPTWEAVSAPPAPAIQAEPACDGLLVAVAHLNTRPCIEPGSGATFKDCPDCPEMVVVPSGSFSMGSPENEPERTSAEGPRHNVTIKKPFAVGRFAVTFAEWDACVTGGGCGGHKPSDERWGRGDRPVINVSWDDAQAYVKWLSDKTHKEYRLLSEAEREYAARAGTTTPFWWGSSITPDQANYNWRVEPYKGGGKKGEYRQKTMPVKSFKPNPWGLYQVHGNVLEWVEDCWTANYDSAPSDGSARATRDCSLYVLRGGSLSGNPRDLRAAYRVNGFVVSRLYVYGLRVARTLNP